MQSPPEHDPQPLSLEYQPPSSRPPRRLSYKVFWTAFCVFGLLLALISAESFGRTHPVAILLQSACVLWVASLVLHTLAHRLQHLFAAVAVLVLWVPVAALVARRVYVSLEIPANPAPVGSPASVVLGFFFEQLVFLPLTFLLWVLVRYRPWRLTDAAARTR